VGGGVGGGRGGDRWCSAVDAAAGSDVFAQSVNEHLSIRREETIEESANNADQSRYVDHVVRG